GSAVGRTHDAVGGVAVLVALGDLDVAVVVDAGGAAQAARHRHDAAGAVVALHRDVAGVGDADRRAFAAADGVDRGRQPVTVVFRDDVAAVVDGDAALRLRLDAGGVGAVCADVAGVADRDAGAAGGVDAVRVPVH